METTVNIDLNDPRSLEIAEVLGNSTCKKILSLIANKEMTETDIAKELNMPLNTVDYNVKKLVKAGLIESSSHWWSVKGKKIPAYKISDKKIVISPKNLTKNILVLPALLIGGVLALGVKYLTRVHPVVQVSADLMAAKSADAGLEMASLASVASEPVAQSANFISTIAGWEWFLIGIWAGTILFFILTKFNGGKNK